MSFCPVAPRDVNSVHEPQCARSRLGAVEAVTDLNDELFQLLLQVAGRLPDETVALARSELAEGHLTRAASRIAHSFVHSGRLLRRWQCGVLLRARAPETVLRQAVQSGQEEGQRYRFSGGQGVAAPDRAAVGAARREPSVQMLWRAVRSGTQGRQRVFVAELTEHGDPIDFTQRLQRALTEAGEAPPLAEVYRRGSDLPPYQRLARREGDLLWAA